MTCSHSLSAHLHPGSKCGYCGTTLTAEHIAGADLSPEDTRQHSGDGEPGCTPEAPVPAIIAAGGSSGSAGRNQDSPDPPATPTLFDQPAARFTDPATSHQAARTASGRAAERRRAVLLAHAAAGDHGLTGEELAAACGEPYEVVGPRRPALVKCGWITPPVGQRRNSRGNAMDVHRITDAGRMEAARQAAQKATAA